MEKERPSATLPAQSFEKFDMLSSSKELAGILAHDDAAQGPGPLFGDRRSSRSAAPRRRARGGVDHRQRRGMVDRAADAAHRALPAAKWKCGPAAAPRSAELGMARVRHAGGVLAPSRGAAEIFLEGH